MNKSQKIKEATRLFWLCPIRHSSIFEMADCLGAIERDPTGALRCYRAILNSYGG